MRKFLNVVAVLSPLLVASGTTSALAQGRASTGCPRPAAGASVQPPSDMFSNGDALVVTLDYTTSQDADGRALFCLRTADGVQSPALHLWPGETLDMTVRNTLPPSPAGAPTETISDKRDSCGAAVMTEASTNVHFHGLNVAPTCGSDEVIHTLINPGQLFRYRVAVPSDEPPGLYWYHPHVHGMSEPAVQGGASGVIVVEGIETLQPSLAGLPERILILRDQVVAGNPVPGGTVPSWDASVNYVPIAYPAMVPARIGSAGHGREFWRLANASADTVFDLQLAYDGVAQGLDVVCLDGVPTGSQDGSRTGRVVRVDHILVPPGGRAEFVTPAPPPGMRGAVLRTRNIDTGPLGDNDPDRTLATIVFDDPGAPSLRTLPSAAISGRAHPQRFEGLDAAPVSAYRRLYFSEVVSNPSDPASPTNFFITVDGATPVLFDPVNPPAITTRAGSVEEWTIENRAGEVHEFHMHQIHFRLLARDGTPVPAADRQFLDTVQLPYWKSDGPYPSVTLRMDFRGMVVGDFVYHCHILGHEDNGMMAIIRVLPPA